MQTSIDMDSNRIINLANGSLASDAINLRQLDAASAAITTTQIETIVSGTSQTVFTLSLYEYVQGVKQLRVFVDGIYQNPDQYDETSPNTVTFNQAVPDGLPVTFIINSEFDTTQIEPSDTVSAITQVVTVLAGSALVPLTTAIDTNVEALQVYVNGIKTEDYTETSSTLLTLDSAVTTDSTVVVFSLVTQSIGINTASQTSNSLGGSVQDFLNDGYARTTGEVSAGVTPTNYNFPPGDVRRYGAVDGADSTTAIQAAIDAADDGATVYIPEGTYTVSSTINGSDYVSIRGAGRQASLLKYTGSATCLNLATVSTVTVSDLGLLTDQAGSTIAIKLTGNKNTLRDLYIGEVTTSGGNGWGTGVQVTGSSSPDFQCFINTVANVYVEHARTVGFLVTRAADTFMQNCSSHALSTSTTTEHLIVDTGASGLYINAFSCTHGLTGLKVQHTIDTGVGAYASPPVYLFFKGFLADTITYGHGMNFDTTLGNNDLSAILIDCWAAAAGLDGTGTQTTAAANGVLINGGHGLEFQSCRIRRNASNGIIIDDADVSHVKIMGCFIGDNNVNDGSNPTNADSHGVYITKAITDVTISDCTIGNEVIDSGGDQKYGIKVSAVALDEYLFTGNNLNGNTTGPISNGATGEGRVRDNLPVDDWVTYTPTYASDGGALSIGNGTISGDYLLDGDLCHVRLYFKPGSTTTFGSSSPFQFGLPFTVAAAAASLAIGDVGSVYIDDTGSGWASGIAVAIPGTAYFKVRPSNGTINASQVHSATPMTWANGDSLVASITYRVA